MGFLRRMFSPDHRAARAAEAAGDPDAAATHYGLAGDREGAVRMHLARAARAPDRAGEIAALRDALHWAGDEAPLVAQASAALGRALVAKAKAEGIATARDRERVREAATLLVAGGAFREAGDAFQAIDDLAAAAQAFSDAGLIDRVERALGEDELRATAEKTARDAFADYELHRRLGRRSQAKAALAASLAAEPSDDRQRVLDALAADLISGGRVELRPRGLDPVIVTARPLVALGRDAVCDLPLRAGGVSRRHAEIEVSATGFTIGDGGSRNGTLIGGLPVAGKMPLVGAGAVELGEDCKVEYELHGSPGVLFLRIATGLDRGRRLVVTRPGQRVDLTATGLACELVFEAGAPWLGRPAGGFQLGADRIGTGAVQLIVGDVLTWDDLTIDVAA
ncbi:MAG: FHA domain-containing protein [Myxococcales bacterium]|nr:FHA domain-containing protein [Myxococcales bacterium]